MMKKFSAKDIVSTALILLALMALTHATGLFSRVDNVLFDLGQKAQHQPAPSDIIIVGIDETSLSRLGRWPWSRKAHAQLIDSLAQDGAAAIGLDIIFAEPDLQDKNADSVLSESIRKAGNVVLPVLIESTRVNGQVIETLPLPTYADNAADLGRVHAVLDEDGIARSIYLYEGVGEPVWQHFAQALLNVSQHLPSKNKFSDALNNNQTDANISISLVRKDQRKINYLGPSGHFQTISYVQVMNGEFPKNLFKNKIVLVGATAVGLGDQFPTPVSQASQLMPGVEFHANVLNSLRTNSLISTAPNWAAMLILAVIALLPLLWLPKLSALKGLVYTLFSFVALSFIAVLIPKFFGVWIPPSAGLFSILLAYPIWSWRKLEAAQKYLDNELSFLKQNLSNIPAANNAADALITYDNFDARIEQVRAASQQLRFLQEDKKETLAFISHDLRAPLARAMMVLQENNVPNQELMAPLSQALNLAEDFLQVSRAEMMNSTEFKELEFASIAHQAVDDAYEAAANKNIALEREIIDGMVWVKGNFGLLQRAMLNLILNAVKFAPAHTTVLVKLSSTAQQATFSVTNDGAGISLEQQQHLFKRFSRSKGETAAISGAGLGLYFVHTVAEKHQGSVGVTSDIGQATCFSLSLPVISFEA
jgi:CHASE2 domain-containing sensor protein/nitrogen-specific signal transduction histidine kinase